MGDLREVVLDTETTGLNTREGHRIIEIGCVELINKIKTGKTFHAYINPQRPVAKNAFAVHGLSDEFLSNKPPFKHVAASFLDFIGKSNLIIHNAPFDMQFLNHEFGLMAMPLLQMHRAVDTLILARKKFPGAQSSLDALCKRFNISLESRNKHGALVDSELLAMVYIKMSEPEQSAMQLFGPKNITFKSRYSNNTKAREFGLSDAERNMHEWMLKKIKGALYNSNK